jgi:hypothetical protein
VLGSPKFDAVINTRREDCKLPDEWRELIADKKVVFYNTNVNAILHGNEQYMKKLRHALDTFRKRDDVALLWRPHPMNEATYKSMRPQLLAEYEQIVADYKRGAWGIYDDTPDLHRSIVWSDAYYGDGSSVVALYLTTGKPVMLQSLATVEADENKKYSSIDDGQFAGRILAFDGENYWFSNRRDNALLKLDRASGEVEYIGRFPGESIFQSDLYFMNLCHNGKIYFAPCMANTISVYDIQANKFHSIELLPLEELPNCATDRLEPGDWKFFGAVVPVGKYIYFTPASNYPALLRLDTENYEVEYITDFLKPLAERYFKYHEFYSFKSCFLLGETLLITSSRSNAVIEFDISSRETNILYIEDGHLLDVLKKGGQIGEFVRHEDNFWLNLFLPSPPYYYRSLLQWRYSDQKVCKFTDLRDVVEYEEGINFLMTGGLYANGHMWYASDYPGKSIKIDVRSGEVSSSPEFNCLAALAEEAGTHLVYDSVAFPGHGVVGFGVPDSLPVAIEWDFVRGEFRRFDLVLDVESSERYVKLKKESALSEMINRQEQTALHETRYFDLDNYLAMLHAQRKPAAAATGGTQPNSGVRIYGYIKNTVMND